MKQENPYFTVMVLSSSTAEPNTYKVKKSWLKVFAGITVASLAVTIFIFTRHFFLLEEHDSLTSVSKLYDAQKQEIFELNTIVSGMSDDMEELDEYAGKLRAITGLPNKEILKIAGAGVGGEEFEDSGVVWEKVNPVIATLQEDILNLQNNVAIQKYNYKDIYKNIVLKNNILVSTPSIWPTEGWLSSSYGKRISPFTGRSAMHKGIDIANKSGTPIVATADGVIKKVGKNRYLGNYVRIKHGNGIETLYAHMKKYEVKKGENVKRGQVIGKMGTTGRSTAPHLHYSVIKNKKTENPQKYIVEE